MEMEARKGKERSEKRCPNGDGDNKTQSRREIVISKKEHNHKIKSQRVNVTNKVRDGAYKKPINLSAF
ncbi:hypothetical protein BALCAV_0203790 [Alkalihalobacillus alcalophilus ATCC 27647 = CGMCC 1.3604]|uniref:Uncharacterized protein n=1 Tax=Alkalihalobacillus alcalophilus ATCC 27647 = CGMCC 1.3604 TaxID=1218173 RepID=A0A094WLI3_ALKAL|nr:hypothetical protein [Alkalihalobacillus alcalophilus]KGA98619.1 hypothetical protein BALCAV_0203790 [Alkalihalobacillus alcalophilus ATCC 27647 = CGMCC 1.3604]MED1560462.1 hypothetical protein [Alkalihalobacillus alcalophilus]